MSVCKQKIIKIILQQPITFKGLTNQTQCAAETICKYVEELEQSGKISSKKSKFKIFYNPQLDLKKVEFYELMLNSSIKKTVWALLESSDLSQEQIEKSISKSRPTVSRALNTLVGYGIVHMKYNAPFKTFYIKDKSKILSWIIETNPVLYKEMQNIIEMFDY